jgi:hypothetical protein
MNSEPTHRNPRALTEEQPRDDQLALDRRRLTGVARAEQDDYLDGGVTRRVDERAQEALEPEAVEEARLGEEIGAAARAVRREEGALVGSGQNGCSGGACANPPSRARMFGPGSLRSA